MLVTCVDRVRRMVPLCDQSAQDCLLHLCRLPQVTLLHERVARRRVQGQVAGTSTHSAHRASRLFCSRLNDGQSGTCSPLRRSLVAICGRLCLQVVACEPIPNIMAVDPSAFPHASNALAYLDGGGQVIFHGKVRTLQTVATTCTTNY